MLHGGEKDMNDAEAKDIGKSIWENLSIVRSRIGKAAERSGRDAGGVRLLVASKTRSPVEIAFAVEAGVDAVGENRVQEFLAKKVALPEGVDWHFIGHLQRNKVKYLIGEVSLIHSVDSVALAQEIGRRAKSAGLVQGVLLQVNVAGEQSKSGFSPGEMEAVAEKAGGSEGLSVEGLSTIAPFEEDPESARPVFGELRELLVSLRSGGATIGCELSMGMTNDYEIAIEEGSTIVRIGTAVFGDRD